MYIVIIIWIENIFACEHNGTKTEFYRTNTKSQGLVPAHFALIIIIVVHVYSKTSISSNKYMQKAGEHENDAGFLKHVVS